MDIAVIGAGASGMMAALTAAKNKNCHIHIFERQSRVGRKLLATGNGRCNLSHTGDILSAYHGEAPQFAEYALKRFGPENTLRFFEGLGLYTVTEPSGRVYPYSDQANSVVDILRLHLNRPNITLHTGFEVKKLQKTESGFTLTNGEETVRCQKVIVACGGLAGSKLGGSLSGYQLLGKLGHKATRLRPALVQIKSRWQMLPALKGIRTGCQAVILHNGKPFAQSTGELQFTEQGLSGPVIFEISRDVCSTPGSWVCRLNFLPDMPKERLISQLLLRKKENTPLSELLTGILHNRLGRVLCQCAGLPQTGECGSLTGQQIESLCDCVYGLAVDLTEPMGMDSAQVTAGGVLTSGFDDKTMESKLVPGLYACGEVLDIDGDCGGYNLQWAWSSGYLAGSSAGEVAL